jgi:hypothetical protein
MKSENSEGGDIISQVENMANQGVATNEIVKLLAMEVQRLTCIIKGQPQPST